MLQSLNAASRVLGDLRTDPLVPDTKLDPKIVGQCHGHGALAHYSSGSFIGLMSYKEDHFIGTPAMSDFQYAPVSSYCVTPQAR